MAYRSDIIRALDELMVDEVGMRFQGIAVVHAKQKWPQLVACERKWDGGLDAHADGTLEPDGKGIGLACSTTPTIGKIKRDARETNRHHPDIKVLIFSTAGKVSEHQKEPWADEILKTFGLHLIVVSREEFITWLLDPARSDICRDQLGIALPMPPELEPALRRAQEAAKETADNWDRTYRKPGRPVISLKAVKLDEHGNPNEAATTDSLGAALDEGQRRADSRRFCARRIAEPHAARGTRFQRRPGAQLRVWRMEDRGWPRDRNRIDPHGRPPAGPGNLRS